MNATTRMILMACAGLALAACTSRPHLTSQQVESVTGLPMEAVEAKLGKPHVVTNAGDTVWWDYDNIVTPSGNEGGTCQVIFKKEKVDSIKC